MSNAQRLKALDIWMTWRMATPRDRDPFKLPLNARTGGAASSMDAHTWTSYDNAARALEAHANWNGLAFALRHNVWVVDLDGCRPEGVIEPWAASIIKRLDSYTELSPSGHGVHVIMFGDESHMIGMKLVLDPDRRVELYKTAHYFTFTGLHVDGTPTDLQDRTEAFEALRAEVEARRTSSASAHSARRAPERAEKPATAAKLPAGATEMTDEELLALARSGSSGVSFSRLYDDGDMSDYKDDHSAADMGLCGRLAFWTGKDPERIDTLFRESALMRPKWDTRRGLGTYGENTVQVAINNAGDIYEGKGTDSSGWLEKMKAKRAAKVAKTQIVGSTVEAGAVRSDISRGADKTAFKKYVAEVPAGKEDEYEKRTKPNGDITYRYVGNQVAQRAAEELSNATPEEIELMRQDPKTRELLDDLRARFVIAGSKTSGGHEGLVEPPADPAVSRLGAAPASGNLPVSLDASRSAGPTVKSREHVGIPPTPESTEDTESREAQVLLKDFVTVVIDRFNLDEISLRRDMVARGEMTGDVSQYFASGGHIVGIVPSPLDTLMRGDPPHDDEPDAGFVYTPTGEEDNPEPETAHDEGRQQEPAQPGSELIFPEMPIFTVPVNMAESVNVDSEEERLKRPSIQATKRPLEMVTADALDALAKSNEPPRVFQRGRLLMRVVEDEKARPTAESLHLDAMRGEFARSANYFINTEKGTVQAVDPPINMVKDALSIASYGKRFPSLEGIVESPVLRPDGSVQWQFGYDDVTLLFYHPSGLVMPAVPDIPQPGHVAASVSIIEDIIGEFPFDSEASKANAYAMLLTPIVRPYVNGQAPLGLLDAPQQGTGKSLFASVNSIIATGQEAPAFTAPIEEAEWRKAITSMVRAGYTYILIDNVDLRDFRSQPIPLHSSALSAVLTTGWHRDRILGVSEPITLMTKATWFASGNNLQVSGDLIRRVYRTRLDAGVSRPWKRAGFKHPQLKEYVHENRAKILWALLTMSRAWVVAGSPLPDNLEVLGSFESWSRVIGGILAYAGVPGFLGELELMYEEADSETPEWEAFLSVWREKFGPQWVTSAALAREISDDRDGRLRGVLPGYLNESVASVGFTKRLGNQLVNKKGMRMGRNSLYIVTRRDPHTKGAEFRVLGKDDAVGEEGAA